MSTRKWYVHYIKWTKGIREAFPHSVLIVKTEKEILHLVGARGMTPLPNGLLRHVRF
jgi:hypothetical protein